MIPIYCKKGQRIAHYRSQYDPTNQPIHPLKNKYLCIIYRAYENRTLTNGCHGHNSLEYLKKGES